MPFPTSFPFAPDFTATFGRARERKNEINVYRKENLSELFFNGPNINRDLNGAELFTRRVDTHTHTSFLTFFLTRGVKKIEGSEKKEKQQEREKKKTPSFDTNCFRF